MNFGTASSAVPETRGLANQKAVESVTDLLNSILSLSGDNENDARIIANAHGGPQPSDSARGPEPIASSILDTLCLVRGNLMRAADEHARAKRHIGL